jgi:hypothetical protein
VRGDAIAASCTYIVSTTPGYIKPKAAVSKHVKISAIDVRGRIDRLENLIRSIISDEGNTPKSKMGEEREYGSTSPQPAAGDSRATATSLEYSDDSSSAAGGQKLTADTRSTHWDAILLYVCWYGTQSHDIN